VVPCGTPEDAILKGFSRKPQGRIGGVLEAYPTAPRCPPTRRYSTDPRGISVGGVVGGVFGCLLTIAGAVILYKTWRVLEVKRVGRNRKELVMLGGGTTAR
jgi:hypothetical protein